MLSLDPSTFLYAAPLVMAAACLANGPAFTELTDAPKAPLVAWVVLCTSSVVLPTSRLFAPLLYVTVGVPFYFFPASASKTVGAKTELTPSFAPASSPDPVSRAAASPRVRRGRSVPQPRRCRESAADDPSLSRAASPRVSPL